MKICAAQIKPLKGDIQSNIENHITLIDLATTNGANLIVFPELSLTGYEPSLAKELATSVEDNRFDVFQKRSDSKQITIGVGVPIRAGSGVTIGMVLFQPHSPRQVYAKKFLHPDEKVFFTSGLSFPVLKVNVTHVALAICYELSIPEHVETAVNYGAGIYMASVAKSTAGVTQACTRLSVIAQTYSMPVLMSNCIGQSEGFVNAGTTSVWNHTGSLVGQLNDTDEGIIIYDSANQELIQKTV